MGEWGVVGWGVVCGVWCCVRGVRGVRGVRWE